MTSSLSSLAPYLDMAGTWVAVILTLFVFSYLLGDNALYRLAEHIFVGVAVGYAVVVVYHTILLPKIVVPLAESWSAGNWNRIGLVLIPAALGLLLLTKSFRRARPVSWLGSLSVAVLLGVGAALSIGGALFGTLWPQVEATADVARYVRRYGQALGLFSGAVVVLGTTGVLLHFYFGASDRGPLAGLRAGLVRAWGGLGRWFVVVTFGALLATVFVSRLSLLVERIQFLLQAVGDLLGGWG